MQLVGRIAHATKAGKISLVGSNAQSLKYLEQSPVIKTCDHACPYAKNDKRDDANQGCPGGNKYGESPGQEQRADATKNDHQEGHTQEHGGPGAACKNDVTLHGGRSGNDVGGDDASEPEDEATDQDSFAVCDLEAFNVSDLVAQQH